MSEVRFVVSEPLGGASPEEVWSRARDVGSMPLYWHGHREVRVVSDEGSSKIVRIRFAFPGPFNVGTARAFIDDARRELRIEHLKGPIRGPVVVRVSEREITCEYGVRLSPWLSLSAGWVRGHFEEGARHALQRLVSGTSGAGK